MMCFQFKRFGCAAAFALAIVGGLPPDAARAAISIVNSAITLTDPQTVYDSAFQAWNNVGDLADNTTFGGGVYLRNGWVLAPVHIGANPNGFYFGGVFHPRDTNTTGVRIYNDPGTNASPTDLILYKVLDQGLPALPEVTIQSATPAIGTTVLMAGFGLKRQTALTYWDSNGNPSSTPPAGNYHEGYQWDTTGDVKRWGTNTVSVVGHTVDDGSGTFKSLWTTFTDPNTVVSNANDPGGAATPYEAAAAPGDSGGGVFVKTGSTWALAGLMHAIDPFPSPQNDSASVFYNPALDGAVADDNNPFAARTFISDLSQYAGQINAVTVPEPGAGVMLAALAAASMLRRRAALRKKSSGQAARAS